MQLNDNNEEINYIQQILIKDLETKKEFTLEKIPYKFKLLNSKKLVIIIALESEYGNIIYLLFYV